MSELERLIQELCPEGVEYKSIGECVQRISNIKWATATGVYSYIDLSSVDRDTHQITETQTISADNAPSRAQQIVFENDVLFGTTRPTLKRYCIIDQEYDGQICSTGFCVLRAKENVILPRWLLHIVSSSAFYSHVEANQKGAGYPAISDKEVKQFKMPVPPIEVQYAIVQILDNFTEAVVELVADIKKECTLRKKQYLEYSHTLFTQSDCVKRTTLGEIVDICMCKRIKKAQTDTVGDVPFYQNGTLGGEAKLYISNELFQEYSQKYKFPNQGDVMLSTVGTVGKTIQYDGKPAYFQDSNIVWLKRKNEDVTNEYLYWFCISMPWKLPERATLKHLHNYMIAETEISIPSKERQAYVIAKFQELESAFRLIDAELTAEIEARQKQYEYYRDKLLTFKVK